MSIQDFRQRITDRRQKQADLDGRVNTAIDLASALAKDLPAQFEFFGDVISQAKPNQRRSTTSGKPSQLLNLTATVLA
jgi:hypothetical protein